MGFLYFVQNYSFLGGNAMQKRSQAKQSKKRFGLKGLMTLIVAVSMLIGTQVTVFANQQGQVTGPVQVLQVDTSLNVEVPMQQGEDGEYIEIVPIIEEIPWQWIPISVSNEIVNGFNAVRRTYALPPDVNPAVINTAPIEMFGQEFNFAYIVQQNTANETFKELRYTVQVETSTSNMTDVLNALESELRYDRDGFAGTLTLDIHSISIRPAGQTRHTSTATRQRTFPHLSAPDNAFIPRTITDGGNTFTLTNVEWSSQSGGSAIDGHQAASSFTATATFSRQVTQTRTTGYVTTAEYVGTVFRTVQGYTIFTAIFYGEPVVEIWLEEPVVEPIFDASYDGLVDEGQLGIQTGQAGGSVVGDYQAPRESRDMGNLPWIVLSIVGGLLAVALIGAGAFFFGKRRGENNVTVLSHHSPSEIVKTGKVKMDAESDEPVIALDEVVGGNPAKTGVYTIRIAKPSAIKIAGKTVRVELGDEEVRHPIPLDIATMYDFDVKFTVDGDAV